MRNALEYCVQSKRFCAQLLLLFRWIHPPRPLLSLYLFASIKDEEVRGKRVNILFSFMRCYGCYILRSTRPENLCACQDPHAPSSRTSPRRVSLFPCARIWPCCPIRLSSSKGRVLVITALWVAVVVVVVVAMVVEVVVVVKIAVSRVEII